MLLYLVLRCSRKTAVNCLSNELNFPVTCTESNCGIDCNCFFMQADSFLGLVLKLPYFTTKNTVLAYLGRLTSDSFDVVFLGIGLEIQGIYHVVFVWKIIRHPLHVSFENKRKRRNYYESANLGHCCYIFLWSFDFVHMVI